VAEENDNILGLIATLYIPRHTAHCVKAVKTFFRVNDLSLEANTETGNHG